MIVHLHIRKPLLRAYVAHLFEMLSTSERPDNLGLPIYKVTKTNDFGQLLCSMVRYANKPVRAHQGEGLMIFKLPHDRSLQSAPNYHLFYSKEDTLKLNDYLEAIFNIHFDRYYLKGRQKQIQQKDIISTFIVVHNLSGLEDIAGTLKKRKYREEAKFRDELIEQLRHRAINRNDRMIFDESQVVKTTFLNY